MKNAHFCVAGNASEVIVVAIRAEQPPSLQECGDAVRAIFKREWAMKGWRGTGAGWQYGRLGYGRGQSPW